MARSFCNLVYHIVFSTKERRPLIGDDVRDRLHEYLGGAIKGEQGIPLIVGEVEDHVHILARLRQDKALSDIIRGIKANSSGWIHREFPDLGTFAWQAGYGAFTVSQSQIERVRVYIARQEQHHRRMGFKAEFLTLLRSHENEFDERYVFD